MWRCMCEGCDLICILIGNHSGKKWKKLVGSYSAVGWVFVHWVLCTYIHAYIHASWILDLLCWILFVFLLEIPRVKSVKSWLDLILQCVGSLFVGCYVHTHMHTYMHLGSWIFCVGSYLYSYAVVIDVVNIGSFLHHVGSYQSTRHTCAVPFPPTSTNFQNCKKYICSCRFRLIRVCLLINKGVLI